MPGFLVGANLVLWFLVMFWLYNNLPSWFFVPFFVITTFLYCRMMEVKGE